MFDFSKTFELIFSFRILQNQYFSRVESDRRFLLNLSRLQKTGSPVHVAQFAGTSEC